MRIASLGEFARETRSAGVSFFEGRDRIQKREPLEAAFLWRDAVALKRAPRWGAKYAACIRSQQILVAGRWGRVLDMFLSSELIDAVFLRRIDGHALCQNGACFFILALLELGLGGEDDAGVAGAGGRRHERAFLVDAHAAAAELLLEDGGALLDRVLEVRGAVAVRVARDEKGVGRLHLRHRGEVGLRRA